MEQHTYSIMNRVENDHWWFHGRRAILREFMSQLVNSLGSEREEGSRFQVPSSKSDEELRTQNSKLKTQNLKQAFRILDVGCGTGANLEMLAEFGEAEGVDVSDEALKFCQSKGLKVHKGLAEDLPFEDGEFDIVTALDVVEHLDDDIAGLKEIFRVTCADGKALVFVPAFMWLWGVQDDISNHRIRYTKKQITERLAAAGFEVERATYANITFFAPILAGRVLMRATGLRPESENNINVSALNGLLGSVFAAERHWLKKFSFPFGVSIVVTASKPESR
ncbi:MAG: methyltransferase domain-containing protein [Pyrinomonadaceae bacterium]|nr:methyltransferase domain-containing protein [Pyrinomonadaceae bacterium]